MKSNAMVRPVRINGNIEQKNISLYVALQPNVGLC